MDRDDALDYYMLYQKALAEIERLQAEMQELRQSLALAHVEIGARGVDVERRDAEIERLQHYHDEFVLAATIRMSDQNAEIERLRAETELLKDRIDEHHRMFEPMRAEIERLRADNDQ